MFLREELVEKYQDENKNNKKRRKENIKIEEFETRGLEEEEIKRLEEYD